MASREKEWISQFATAHILDDPYRVLPSQGDRHEHIGLLSVYKDLNSILVPLQAELTTPTLWHPDIHASNLFVLPNKKDGGLFTPPLLSRLSSIGKAHGSDPLFCSKPCLTFCGTAMVCLLDFVYRPYQTTSTRWTQKLKQKLGTQNDAQQSTKSSRECFFCCCDDDESPRRTNPSRRSRPGDVEIRLDTLSVRFYHGR